jgi:hypothetical protein
MWMRSLRSPDDHSLLAFARLAVKDQPMARLTLPLAGGGLLPVDAGPFRGVGFDVRGDGAYRLLLTLRGRSVAQPLAARFTAGPEWQHVTIPFAELKAEGLDAPWTKDVLTLAFELTGPPAAQRWIELDNVGFVR